MDVPAPPRWTALEPVLGFRFVVNFFHHRVGPNPVDICFARVSGLQALVKTSVINEGGQNLYAHRLPDRIEYGNLVLERGYVVGSTLHHGVIAMLTAFKFTPSNVFVTLLHDVGAPIGSWLFVHAFPVRWSTSDLDAAEGKVVIDTLELAYTRMQIIRI